MILLPWVSSLCVCGYMVEFGLQNVTIPALLDSFTDVVYVASAVLFIFSILGLGQQESARAGNWWGVFYAYNI